MPDLTRVIAYVRVSKERDEGVSPDIQIGAINAYCRERGYTIVRTLQDLDLTGRLWKRRQIEEAVSMIEAGQADVIVVWKISRVSRNRLDWNIAVDRIESVGGKVESATERLDTTTSTGRFTRGMLAELAAFESERIGEAWKEANAQRIARGLPASGKARWGYVYENNRYTPDPITGPVLRDMYVRYTAGESARQLATWLSSEGHLNVAGNEWTGQRLVQTLDSGFGAGLIVSHGNHFPGAQSPVITSDVWEAYRTRRQRSLHEPPRSRNPRYSLSGMLKCGACGATLRARNRAGYEPGTFWICAGPTQSLKCPEGWTQAYGPRVLRELREWVLERSAAPGVKVKDMMIKTEPKRQTDPAVKLRKTIARTETRLLELARKNLDGFYDDPTYLDLRDQARRARDEAQKELDQLRPAPAREAFLTVAEAWDELASEPWQQREALRTLLRHVLVVKGDAAKPSARRNTYIPVPLWSV